MAGFNQVILLGNVVRDPEIKTVGEKNTLMARFTIASNRGEETTFVDIVAWGKRAQTVQNHVTKGMSLLVTGSLVIRSYEGQNGKAKATEISLDQMQFTGAKKSAPAQQEAALL